MTDGEIEGMFNEWNKNNDDGISIDEALRAMEEMAAQIG